MIFKNNTPDLTLAAAIGATDTTITINEDVSWVGIGMTLVIDPGQAAEEAVLVRGVNTVTKTIDVYRGIDGYTAQSHGAGATVRHMVTALSLHTKLAGHLPFRLHNPNAPTWWTPAAFQLGGFRTDLSVSWGSGYLFACPFAAAMRIKQMAIATGSAGSSDGTTHFALYKSYITYPEGTVIPKWRLWKTTFVADAAATYYFDLTTSPIIVEPGIYFWALANPGYTTTPKFYYIPQASFPFVMCQHFGPQLPSQAAWRVTYRYSAANAMTSEGDPTPPDIESYNLWDFKPESLVVWLETELI